MRAENFTVAGVMSLNRQIRRTSSASAKSDRQSGRSVECAVMRALVTGESGWLGLAQSSAVRALPDGEFAAMKSRCGLGAGAVEASGSQSLLRDGFSLASGMFLAITVDSTKTVEVSATNCANDIDLGEIDRLVGNVLHAVGEGMSSSLLMVGAPLILADTGSSEASVWSNSKGTPMMSETGCEASGAVSKCDTIMRPEHRAALVSFGKGRRAVRASEVMPSLCSEQVFGAGKSVSSLAVRVSQTDGSTMVDTGNVEVRLIACAASNDGSVFAKVMRSVTRRPACALSSRTRIGSKSGGQWSVQ